VAVRAKPTPSKRPETAKPPSPKPTRKAAPLPSLHPPSYSLPARTKRVTRLPKPGTVARVRPRTRQQEPPVRVRVSSLIGTSPLWVAFTADLPPSLRDGADFLWSDNGRPFCYSQRGSTILTEPGVHRIAVLIVTKDNRELTASEKVTVLKPLRR